MTLASDNMDIRIVTWAYIHMATWTYDDMDVTWAYVRMATWTDGDMGIRMVTLTW